MLDWISHSEGINCVCFIKHTYHIHTAWHTLCLKLYAEWENESPQTGIALLSLICSMMKSLLLVLNWSCLTHQIIQVLRFSLIFMGNRGSAAAKSLQSCPTLCNPIDSSPPGSAVPGILQVRTLEWVAISFSSAWKWRVKVKSLSRVWLWATLWTAAYQAPPSMGFSRQEYWSGLPLPSPIPHSIPL